MCCLTDGVACRADTSDHGDYLGFHHMLLKGNFMYDPLIKVPLVVKFPASVEAVQESVDAQRLVNIIDASAATVGFGLLLPRL